MMLVPVDRSDRLPAVYEKQQKRKRKLGRKALKSGINTLKGTGKFVYEARKNTFKGHMHKATIGAVVLTAVWLGEENAPDKDSCTNVQQERVITGSIPGSTGIEKGTPLEVKNFVRSAADALTFGWEPLNNNRTLGDIAQNISDRRGYYIPEERLAALNPKVFAKDSEGKVEGHLPVDSTEGKLYCLRIPGPIYFGYETVDAPGRSLYDIATDTKVDMVSLRAWNLDLGKLEDDQELPIGTLVQTQENINNKLVLRPMTEKDTQRSAKEKAQLFLANAALIGAGEPPDEPGEVGYFPLEGSYLDDDGKLRYGANIVRAAFSIEGTPINVGDSQIRPDDRKPSPIKKTPPAKGKEKKPTTPTPEKTQPPKREIKINTEGLTPSQASIARIIVNTAYNKLGLPDDRKYKAAEIGLITGMVESDLRNLKGGDRDSVGVMQQRNHWGTYAQRRNVQWTVNAFYNGGSKAGDNYSEPGLLDKKGWWKRPSGEVAQDVQRSAFPDKYAKRIDEARKILG